MTLTSALYNAGSGLRVQSKAADVVSGNVANALTPGYARRELQLTTDIIGSNGGVRVANVARLVDPYILADRRRAEAEAGSANTLADGLRAVEIALGDPTQDGSLSQLAAAFSARMIEASSRPDSEPRLGAAVTAAERLAQGYNAVGRDVQQMRTRADTDIGMMVERVNAALRQVDALNEQILRTGKGARDSSPLLETRQQVIDSIAEIVPLREVPRNDGQVALYTYGGAALLDGRPWELSFQPKGIVEPWMSLSGGALSGLSIGGQQVDLSGERTLLGTGALQAAFDLRDRAGPEAQAAIDSLARDLMERFQDPTLDPTLVAGAVGLFADGVLAFDPLNEEGLAQRIAVNPAVFPDAGGDVWRLRDGLGATAPGDPGQSALLTALGDRFDAARAPLSGPQAGQARSVGDQIAIFLSGVSGTRQALETEQAFQNAQFELMRGIEASNGVDTDDEMQKLLTIEQAFGANARVIQTIDTLMDELLRI